MRAWKAIGAGSAEGRFLAIPRSPADRARWAGGRDRSYWFAAGRQRPPAKARGRAALWRSGNRQVKACSCADRSVLPASRSARLRLFLLFPALARGALPSRSSHWVMERAAEIRHGDPVKRARIEQAVRSARAIVHIGAGGSPICCNRSPCRHDQETTATDRSGARSGAASRGSAPKRSSARIEAPCSSQPSSDRLRRRALERPDEPQEIALR